MRETADNIIRNDLIKLDFKITGLREVGRLQTELDGLRRMLMGGIGEDAFDELRENARRSVSPLEDVNEEAGQLARTIGSGIGEDAFDELREDARRSVSSLEDVNEEARRLTGRVTELGKKASTVAFAGLKKLASVSFKALTIGLGAATVAVGGLVKKSVSAYADFEQLTGGVETLFKEDANRIKKYANDAFKTAGLSANEYMDTVTSFSASLISSCGGDTAKASELAQLAIVDMSDNANKMGSDMESITETYKSLAKGNYEMLDNLKLGYGGTKSEMERLIKTAAKTDKSIKANDLSYANIVKSIHEVQKNMDIMGTTQKEAETTITGSLNMVKSAWGNLLPSLIEGGDSFDQCIDNLVYSMSKFGERAKPAILKALSGVGKLIEELAPHIAEQIPKLVDGLLPPLIKASLAIVQGLIKALPNILGALIKEVPNIIKSLAKTVMDTFGEQFSFIKKIGNFFSDNAESIAKNVGKIIPVIGGLAAAFKGFKMIKSASSLFGRSENSGDSGGILGGLAETFKKLAKTEAKTILKGMLNLAIIFAGMSALFLIISAVSLVDFDIKKILKIIAMIAILGIAGAALAKLAGIIGNIPVSVVLSGLGNMALIIGGLTAIIAAFGALSKIDGFNDFITSGGDALANLFKQIGKIGGSLIGGIGEGISNSFPKIGENLSAFAESLKPLFSTLNGVDMSGVGSVFSEIGKFMALMAANDLISFFTGSTDFKGIGTQLNDFAISSRGFFEKMASFPVAGFENAKALFQSLADIGNVPNTGGIAQWFSGNDDYTALADGLRQLSSPAVIGFYKTMSELPQSVFENIKALFQSLADIGNIPNTGGIGQWFSGNDDYTALADGLRQLSSPAVIGFYKTVSSLPQSVFENTKALFQSLADIGNIPNTGGIGQWFSGEDDFSKLAKELPLFGISMALFYRSISGIKDFGKISQMFEALSSIDNIPNTGGIGQWFSGEDDLSGIGGALKQFGLDTKDFFAQINKLNISNLNGLWDSLGKAANITTNFSDIVGSKISEIVMTVENGGKKIVELITQTMGKIVEVVRQTKLNSVGTQMINGLILGMNNRKSAAVSAARSVAQAINSEYAKVQEIHSPSRVWSEFGGYQIQGAINGMEGKMSALQTVVQKAGEISTPYNSYTPESSATYSNSRTNNNEYNTYSPQFNLTISGSDDDRATERKFKKWFNEAMNDTVESMRRKNPRMQEV